ncbi:hypothetical protein EE612_016983, partial [Oryza sativa]
GGREGGRACSVVGVLVWRDREGAATAMPKLPMDQRPRLTLEDYILFFTTRSGHGLTMDHLNQIVFMHGFIKFHRQNKPVIVDALNKFDLMRPRRSTVGINAAAPPRGAAKPSDALLTMDEARDDIEDLGWRECPVGSLLSIRAGGGDAAPSAAHMPIAAIRPGSTAVERVSPPSILSACSPAPPGAVVIRKRCKKGQGKAAMRGRKRRVVQLLTLPSVENLAATA